MNNSYTKFQVKNLRMVNNQRLLESLMVMLLALFSMAVLPSLLVQYVYANQNLTQAPKLLEMIPVICYGVSALHAVFVLVTNGLRGRTIKRLEQDLYFSNGMEDADSSENVDDAELQELEKMVDEAMASKSKTKKTAKKAASKKRK